MRKSVLKKQYGSRGMSLVELLVVMAIMSIVIMAVLSLYIPVQQSTLAQTQVSDVQSNLRLALKTMSRDLLLAGFLVPNDPVIFEATASPAWTVDNPDHSDFTIRTRIVGNDFARTQADVVANLAVVVVTSADMADNFPDGSFIRLFEPVGGNEINQDTIAENQRVYKVESTTKDLVNDTATFSISTPYGALSPTDIVGETVIVRVMNNTQPGTQTIRYYFEDGALMRTVNGSRQVLARNVDAATSRFDYDDSNGRINVVHIILTGKTTVIGNDPISGEKIRAIKTSVKLRNVS